jgi:hypothetical protein
MKNYTDRSQPALEKRSLRKRAQYLEDEGTKSFYLDHKRRNISFNAYLSPWSS